jgi:alanine racemase
MRSAHVMVSTDCARIRANARAICRRTGVELIAVVKADAYGLGAGEVAGALRGVADRLAVFSLSEAQAAGLWRRSGLPIITLGPPDGAAAAYLRAHVRPAVSTVAQARRLRTTRPIVCLDTGMRRFACPVSELAAVLAAGSCDEVFTHAATRSQARALDTATRTLGVRRHAAASSLIATPAALLDAVRPGLALYHDAVRVSVPLAEVRAVRAAIGYGGFRTARHGVVLAGYAHGLRVGWCLVAGQRRRIREVGMQSAYIELGQAGAPGDEVVLLGDGLTLAELARAWSARPHEVLIALCGAGERVYRHGRETAGPGRAPAGHGRAPAGKVRP